MIILPNGKNYKIIYLDTNAISEIINNTKNFGKNFLLKYVNGEFCFATSIFNVLELSKTQSDFKEKFVKSIGLIPLCLVHSIPQICEYEKENIAIGNDFVMFAIGVKPMFNININDLFSFIQSGNLEDAMKIRDEITYSEINDWNKIRKTKLNTSWQKEFKKNILLSMNEIYNKYSDGAVVKELGKYKSLEIAAYIKNCFIHNTLNEIKSNSIIDSYNASTLPYVEAFVTERTMANWLVFAKSKFDYLKNKDIIKISELFD